MDENASWILKGIGGQFLWMGTQHPYVPSSDNGNNSADSIVRISLLDTNHFRSNWIAKQIAAGICAVWNILETIPLHILRNFDSPFLLPNKCEHFWISISR